MKTIQKIINHLEKYNFTVTQKTNGKYKVKNKINGWQGTFTETELIKVIHKLIPTSNLR